MDSGAHGAVQIKMRALLALGVLVITACSRSTTGPSSAVTLFLNVYPGITAQGDTVGFSINLPSGNLGGDALIFTLSGYGTVADTLTIPEGVTAYTGQLAIPAALPDGTLYIAVSIPAINQTATDSVVIIDNVPPVLVAPAVVMAALPFQYGMNLLSPNNGYGYLGGVDLFVGTPDTLEVIVKDNHALAWAGWTLGPPANLSDSVALTGTADTLAFPLVVPASLLGTAPTLTFFVRDADGNKAGQSLGQAPIAQRLDHPAKVAPLTAEVSDLTWDMKRGLVYLAEPDSMHIAVLSLSTMSYQTPITLPARPIRMDVTPGGDSLLVVFDSTRNLAVVNLSSPAHPFTMFPLRPIFDSTVSPDTAGWISGVRVAADGRAIVTMHSSGDSTNGAIEINLQTDSQRTVAHPNYLYNAESPGIIRSPNADSLIFGAFYYQVSYDATTHSYSPYQYSYNNLGPPVISTNNGTTHYLIGGYALETIPGLTQLGSFGVDPFYLGAIAPDGTEAYRAESACVVVFGFEGSGYQACVDSAAGLVLHYRIPVALNPGTTVYGGQQSGQLLDYSVTPNVGLYWAVSPDAKTLIGIGSKTIMAIDLTQSLPTTERVAASGRNSRVGRIVASREIPLRSRAPSAAVVTYTPSQFLVGMRAHVGGHSATPLRPSR